MDAIMRGGGAQIAGEDLNQRIAGRKSVAPDPGPL
jgi:hypothetical protein